MPIPSKTDILIVGAGPGGSTLAYQLAQKGLDVVLIDKAEFPRVKTCAGGVNFRTIRLLPFDISPVAEETIRYITFSKNFRDTYTKRAYEPIMVTVQRRNFDSFLVDQARKAGTRFHDQTRFLSLTPNNDRVQIETNSGSCRARFLVGADGALSEVAKRLGLMRDVGHILTVHSEVPISAFPRVDPETVHIDWGSLKRTYAYLFPKKSSLAIGAGGLGLVASEIKNYQRSFLQVKWQKDEAPPFGTAGFLLPLRKKRSPIQEGRCLLLGDAAGLADPFTGEGIYYAIRSAQIAAWALEKAMEDGGDSLHAYQETIDREVMPELESSKFLRELFNLRPSFFHRQVSTRERWWNAMVKILRGDKSFLDVKKRLGPVGSILLGMSR
jgi:geranylgeranyl reductase family protein